MDNLADRIDALCVALAERGLAAAAAEAGAQQLLDQLVAEVRAGAEPATLEEHLTRLETALDPVGAGDLLSSRTRKYVPLPDPRRPVEYGWVCPLARCSRVATRLGPGGEAANCAVAGTPLTKVRIRT